MLLLLSFTHILFIYSCGNYKSWTYKTRYDDVECRRFETKTTLIHVNKIYIPWFLSIFINHTYAMLTTTSILFLEFDSIDRCFWSVIKRQESEILDHKHRFYTLFTFLLSPHFCLWCSNVCAHYLVTSLDEIFED